MSARALLNDVRLMEIDMDYAERIGAQQIERSPRRRPFFASDFCGRVMLSPGETPVAGVCGLALLGMLFAAYPAEYYFEHRGLEEWMIYRFVVCFLLGSFGLLLLLATALTSRMASLGPRRMGGKAFWPAAVATLLSGPSLCLILALLMGTGLFFLWPGIAEYWRTRTISLHWSRLIAGTFSLFSALQTLVFAFLMEVVNVWLKQVENLGASKQLRELEISDSRDNPVNS